jgi:hypothetical protein
MLLAALCAAGAPHMVVDKQAEFMELFQVAFGEKARDALNESK